MSNEEEIWKKRLERERNARKQAEKLLEEKKARTMQKMDRELSKEFKQVYANRPVYGTTR